MRTRHEIHVLRRAGRCHIDIARHAGVARRTLQRVDTEATVTPIATMSIDPTAVGAHAP